MSLKPLLPLAAFALLIPLAYGEPAPQGEHADKPAAAKPATPGSKAVGPKAEKAARPAADKGHKAPAHDLKHQDAKAMPPQAHDKKAPAPDCHGKPDCPKHPQKPLPPRP